MTEASFLQLIATASPVVQFVMLLLLLISLASWWVIFRKYFSLSQARAAADKFDDAFWSGVDLVTLYDRLDQPKQGLNGMAAIFKAGFQEFARLRAQPETDPEMVLGSCQRAMRAALGREQEELDTYLPLLATAGSVSPYIGLFGTVWGIMNSFRALGAAQQATLVQVAPGIAEALIATAMGLLAAIPAVVAYNRYATQAERLTSRYDTFMEEFSNILHRQFYRQRKAAIASEAG